MRDLAALVDRLDASERSWVVGVPVVLLNAPQPTLTLQHSLVAGNRAAVSPPNGA
jgi:hypothetical protein